MTSFLIGGAMIFVIGTAMLWHAAFTVSRTWGWLSLVPPLQPVFAALHWGRAWDALLMQVFGLGLVLGFFLHHGGLDAHSRQQALAGVWQQLAREMASARGETVVLDEADAVQAATVEDSGPPVDLSSADVATVTTTVQGQASKAVDDRPIFKCTDPQGKETYSTEPCKGGVTPAPR